MRNKENSGEGALERLLTIKRHRVNFPSARRCDVCSGMARTVVASCHYDSNNIAK